MLRCPACPEKDSSKPFPQPTGPKPARVMLVGEAPFVDEYKQGFVFAGKTGQELTQQYIPMLGLTRDDVYVCNASRCSGRTKTGALDNPTNEQARVCWQYFSQFEMREVKPDLIVTLGAIAADAVLGPDIDLEMQHGIPLTPAATDYYPAAVVPTYHPAAGLRSGEFMLALQDDFRRLRKLSRGDWSDVAQDEYPQPSYFEADCADAIDAYFDAAGGTPYAGVDTEYTPNGQTYYVTCSLQPGTGMLLPRNPGLLLHLAARLKPYTFVLHNALADLGKLQQVGITPSRWTDTMQLAYWLNEFRIGLKPLAYRYCGMSMQEFADVAGPPSKYQLYDYMRNVVDRMRQAVPDSRKGKSMDESEKLVRKALNLCKRLADDIEDDAADGFRKLKPWNRIKEWQDADEGDWKRDVVSYIEAFGGGMPIPQASIANVDRSAAVQYACADCDATLRLLPVLRRKARELRKGVI
jgi:uracil-DNA glycosylase